MRRPARVLGLVVVGLVVAAALLWASSRLVWVSASWDTPLRGRVGAAATGAATEPVLVPWALLALAAVAGVLATSGWGRRAVGTVVAVAGLWALLRAVTGLAPPAPGALPDAARQAGRLAGVEVGVVGPVLAALGAVLLAGAGVTVALTAPRLPRLGAKYDAPTGAGAVSPGPGSGSGSSGSGSSGSGPGPSGPSGRPARRTDPDAELWKALDAGEDPTAAPPPAQSTPPVGGVSADRSDRSPGGGKGPG